MILGFVAAILHAGPALAADPPPQAELLAEGLADTTRPIIAPGAPAGCEAIVKVRADPAACGLYLEGNGLRHRDFPAATSTGLPVRCALVCGRDPEGTSAWVVFVRSEAYRGDVRCDSPSGEPVLQLTLVAPTEPVASGVGAIFRVAGARSFQYDAEWRLVGPTACPAGQPLRAGGVSGVALPTAP